MLVESAEGGAGVLRRLVDDPAALPLAARTALTIMHFHPDTGADLAATNPARGEEPCIRACYDCLLSYGNQSVHATIDRHLVRDLMLRLSRCDVTRTDVLVGDDATRPAGTEPEHGQSQAPTLPRAADFVTWLASQDLRLPDLVDAVAEGTTPDLIYQLPDGNAPSSSPATARTGPQRDEDARDVLRDLGWGVITVGPDADWAEVAARYPSVFGSDNRGRHR